MSLQAHRNIIGVLLSYSRKTGRAIDFGMALKVLLPALPSSIANGVGSHREKVKAS